MATVGTISVRMVADTEQASRDVERFREKQQRTMERLAAQERRRLSEMRTEEARERRRTARAETLAAGAGGALLAGRIYAQQRGLIVQQTIGGLVKRGLAIGLSRALPAVGGALAVAGITRFLFARSQGGAAGRAEGQANQKLTDVHNELVTLVALTRDRNQTMEMQLAEMQRQRDPLRRDLASQRGYLQSLGLGVDARLISQALDDALTDNLLRDIQRAREREALRSPVQDMINAATGLMNEARVFVGSARLGAQRATNDSMRRFFRGMGTAPFLPFMAPTVGGSFMERAQATFGGAQEATGNTLPRIASQLARDLMMAPFGQMGFSFFQPARAAGPSSLTRANAAQAERQRLINARTALGIMGPGNILSAPPTIGAGTEAEYAFRVRQQRQDAQIGQERQWREQMLRLTQELVRQGVPGAGDEALQQQIRANPRQFLVPTQGVD